MFCLTCGTELPRLARVCPSCGTAVGERGDGRDSAPVAALVPVSAVPAPASMPLPQAPIIPESEPPIAEEPETAFDAPSISAGDLVGVSFPREAAGRAVLGAVIILAVDQLLPWVVFNETTHVGPAMLGVPSVLLVLALALSGVPAFAIRLRTHPAWGAAPIALGAFCLSVALTVWALLGPFSTLVANQTSVTLGFRRATGVPQPPSIVPDWGLYIFVLASLALIVAGYRLQVLARESLISLPATQALPGKRLPAPMPSTSAHDQMPDAARALADSHAHVDVQPTNGASVASPIAPLPGTAGWQQELPPPIPLRERPPSWTHQANSARGR